MPEAGSKPVTSTRRRRINEELIGQAYAAFNRQDADTLLAFVSQDVDWPDGPARLHGKQGLRAYWTRQWAGPMGRPVTGNGPRLLALASFGVEVAP